MPERGNMEQFKEPSRKKPPSTKSLNELMNLLMKLNAKLREKISPPAKREENEPGKTDVVIIIMSAQEEKSGSAKTSRRAKPESPKSDWIQGLCEEIERGACTRK
jgi:hypothetical protein